MALRMTLRTLGRAARLAHPLRHQQQQARALCPAHIHAHFNTDEQQQQQRRGLHQQGELRFFKGKASTEDKALPPQKRMTFVSRWIDRLLEKTDILEDPDSRRLISRGLAGALYGSIVLTGMSTIGIDTSALVAGLSVTGLTIGFAARDVASNYIAGLMIIVNRPFVSGDFVKIGAGSNAVDGVVESIDMRYVYLRPKAVEPYLLMVPNDLVMRSVLVVNDNFSHQQRAEARDTLAKDGPAAPPQAMTPAYRNLVRTAWDELPALEEYTLRRANAGDLARISSVNDQKVALWLLAQPQQRAQTEAWTAFIKDNGGALPAWLPASVKTKLSEASSTTAGSL